MLYLLFAFLHSFTLFCRLRIETKWWWTVRCFVWSYRGLTGVTTARGVRSAREGGSSKHYPPPLPCLPASNYSTHPTNPCEIFSARKNVQIRQVVTKGSPSGHQVMPHTTTDCHTASNWLKCFYIIYRLKINRSKATGGWDWDGWTSVLVPGSFLWLLSHVKYRCVYPCSNRYN